MNSSHFRFRGLSLVSLTLFAAACAPEIDEATSGDVATANAAQLKFVPSGLKQLLEGETPQRLQLTATKPETIVKEPGDLVAPKYGTITFGADAANQPNVTPVHIVVDERPDGPKLFVDANRNGDLTDDPPGEWKKMVRDAGEGRQMSMYTGGSDVELVANGPRGHIHMYRFERDVQRFPNAPDLLLYYRDYAWQGQIAFDDRKLNVLLVDDVTAGDFRGKPGPRGSGVRLFIDANGDGRFDQRTEGFDVTRPFNLNGTSYEIKGMAPDGSTFEVAKSSRRVPELGKPIDHRVGATITPFESVDLKGNTVRFPDDYAGKVVLIDFWATWCGPCMVEMPHLVRAYGEFKDKGFEILGVSLDTGAVTKIESTMARQKMTWPQVNDVALGQLYQIRSIPRAYLVDGSTGKIIADGASLRGTALHKTIEQAVASQTR